MEEHENKIQVEKKKLQPLVESNGTLELLRIEIERIKKENEKLESNLQLAELKVSFTNFTNMFPRKTLIKKSTVLLFLD